MGGYIPTDFARKIERELNASKASLHEAQFGKYGSVVLSQERDAWKLCAERLAHAIKEGNAHGYGLRIGDDALVEFDRLKGGLE
jgi:hypothetical protein